MEIDLIAEIEQTMVGLVVGSAPFDCEQLNPVATTPLVAVEAGAFGENRAGGMVEGQRLIADRHHDAGIERVALIDTGRTDLE